MEQPETWKDPIVEEIRQVREGHAKQFDFDLKAIVRDLRRHEQQGTRKVVSFEPKRLEQSKGAA